MVVGIDNRQVVIKQNNSMKTMTKHIYAAFIGAAVLSSCSRPVAYFQRGPVENYHTPKTEVAANVAVATPAPSVEAPATVTEVATPVAAPTEQVAQAKQAVNQIEAYVHNDSKLASSNKLTKRIARVKSLLNATPAQTASATNTNVAAKKMSFLERMTLKNIDKKIKKQLSPERTMVKSMFTIGIIVAAAGLLLLLIGNGFGATLGGIALVVGLILIVLDLVRS